MSDITYMHIRFQIAHGGEVIDLKNLTICPEKISIRHSGEGLRLDVINYDGSNLAWFVLPTPELIIELC